MTGRVPVKPEDVETALAEYLAGTDLPQHVQVREWARYHHALPLIQDMGGCLALRPDGELIAFVWDNEQEVLAEIDPYTLHIARGVGSRKYPQIPGLAPIRPASAKVCPGCNGSGSPRPDIPNLVCGCGGLGWIP